MQCKYEKKTYKKVYMSTAVRVSFDCRLICRMELIKFTRNTLNRIDDDFF